MSTYTILSTTPAVFQDKDNSIVNGVLVKFNIQPYDEVHEVRVAKMDVSLVKAAIEKTVNERDMLAQLGQVEE